MKNKVGITTIILTLFANAYADLPNVDQDKGAAAYDWQSCLNSKMDDCINNCTTSEDTDCNDHCTDMARDKCQSMGINPPQDTLSQ